MSQQVEQDGSIRVSISVRQADGSSAQTLYQRQLAYAVQGSRLKVLRPGVVSVNGLADDPLTFQQP